MAYSGFSLEGKVALVTGAARGIGAALAVGLAEAGADVAVSDMASRLELARDTQSRVEAQGVRSATYELDVLDIGGIPPVIERIIEDFGRLDILINNAGIRIRKPALEVTEADWDATVDTNLKGLFFCAQAAARPMIAQGSGRIVNIGSQFSAVASVDRAPYIASKHGVAGLTRAWPPNGHNTASRSMPSAPAPPRRPECWPPTTARRSRCRPTWITGCP